MKGDPYSIFQGYYVRLRYRISSPENLPANSKPLNYINGKYYYLVLTPDQNHVWQPIQVTERFPIGLARNDMVLKGRYRYGLIEYGIEQYFLPEKQRQFLEKIIREEGEKILVEVKINSDGEAAIVRIKVGGKVFQY